MNQEELARVCLVSRATISNWERGRTQPSAEDVVLLAGAFDVSADELLSACDAPVRVISADRREITVLQYVIWMLGGMLFIAGAALMADLGTMSSMRDALLSWQFLLCMVIVVASGLVSRRVEKLGRRHGCEGLLEALNYAAGARDPAAFEDKPAWMRWLCRHYRELSLGLSVAIGGVGSFTISLGDLSPTLLLVPLLVLFVAEIIFAWVIMR